MDPNQIPQFMDPENQALIDAISQKNTGAQIGSSWLGNAATQAAQGDQSGFPGPSYPGPMPMQPNQPAGPDYNSMMGIPSPQPAQDPNATVPMAPNPMEEMIQQQGQVPGQPFVRPPGM
jgi:hypothetical protein